MQRSTRSVLFGTFTLRLSTSLTGTMLIYYLAVLPQHGGPEVQPIELGFLAAAFYFAELVLAPPFGVISDRLGHHRVMQWGPAFGMVAVLITFATTNLPLLGATRLLEGASTAASVPSILGYIAAVTATDIALRGRTVAGFEGATLIGLGAGIVVAGPLWQLIGRAGFLVNAVIYLVSLLIYRFGVAEADEGDHVVPEDHYGPRRYWRVLTSSHVWLLAPTWIAINASLGLATNQTLFQLVRHPSPEFADQALMGSATPGLVSIGLVAGGVAFMAGLWFWGRRYASFRRTTMIAIGIVGGFAIAIGAAVVNHGSGLPTPLIALFALVVVAGLFVLSGATPAALGLLADLSEAYPADRGAIMGLYSVFLALGQIAGSLLGGIAAQVRGIDGLLLAVVGLLLIALLPIARLRTYEHVVGTTAPGHGRASASTPVDR